MAKEAHNEPTTLETESREASKGHVARWDLDPTHSSIEFAVKHMMLTTVRGRFKAVRGSAMIDEEDPSKSSVEVEIETASIDTDVKDRDAHLRSADFFDADAHPRMTFRSKRIEGAHGKEGDTFRVIGDLTIRDTTLEIPVEVTFEGRGKDPWGKERAGFVAKAELDRREWGLRWNQAIETGGILVANKVRIEAEVQLVRGD